MSEPSEVSATASKPGEGAAIAAAPTGPPAANRPPNRVLLKMLDRLFAALVNGPSLNCRPHRSRQRIDLAQIARLKDVAPAEALLTLLGAPEKVRIKAKTPQPKRKDRETGDDAATEADAARSAGEKAWDEQEAVLAKLHAIAEDARTYEQDTGVHVLNIGFPLLSLPPGSFSASAGSASRRILAPIAFIPVTVTLKRGSSRSVEIACHGGGIDRVTPNTALLSWLQQQTGQTNGHEDLFGDEEGKDPWREISELVRRVCEMIETETPQIFAEGAKMPVAGKGSKNAPEDNSDDDDDSLGTMVESRGAEAGHASSVVEAPSSLSSDPSPPYSGERMGEGPFAQEATVAEPTSVARSPSSLPSPPSTGEKEGAPAPSAPDEFDGDLPIADAGTIADAPTDTEPPPPALNLIAAPRTEETGDAPAVLISAVVGLFPMANQGLLRDMRDMARGEGVSGPVESFLQVDISLEPPAVSGPDAPAEPVVRRTRRFGEERLVAPSDPCQARAVRLARTSRGLVIHGPPGTGKSQTITNVIGDHLARGARVLFVCDKRTALDVVANRLRHLGLGKLLAIVHDPQRDQRELYRGLRQQLDDLAETKTDSHAGKRLEQTDARLQKLHEQLTIYRGALVEPEPTTRLSFHDLMGQWLSTPTPAALQVDEPGLKQLPLPQLDEVRPMLRETLQRGDDVAYANNPWRHAAGISLADLLSRPGEWYRGAIDALCAAARDADATIDPFIPPFMPGAPHVSGPDLPSQAAARAELASQIGRLLATAPADAIARWAAADLPAVQAARKRLTEMSVYLDAMKAGPLDAELFSAMLGHDGALPSIDDLNDWRGLLQKYSDAYNTSAEWVRRIHAAAPSASWTVLARWIAADEKTFTAARNAMAPAAALLPRIKGTSLDPELLATHRRRKIHLMQVLPWQAALETYLPISKSLFGFLHGAKKKAAAPAAEFFGLGLSAESATRVHDFLAALRVRLELLEAMQTALGADAPADLPSDEELLALFTTHYSTIAACIDLRRPSTPSAPPAPGQRVNPITDEQDLVHRLIAADLETATPFFAHFSLFPNPQNTARLRGFIQSLTVRLFLQQFHTQVLGESVDGPLLADTDLQKSLADHAAIFDLILKLSREPLLANLVVPFQGAMADLPAGGASFVEGLKRSRPRAEKLVGLEKKLADALVFAPAWLADASSHARAGEAIAPIADELLDRIDTLEGVVRINEARQHLPDALRGSVDLLLEQSAPADEGWSAIRKVVLSAEITRRLSAQPLLQKVDGRAIENTMREYRDAEIEKRTLVRDAILDHWGSLQRERLLSDTGTRLNGMGADLRRRLTLRGERAMRLRQVIANGKKIDGGDPLFDLCPVWMVSPETVAQVFPREPIFDVVLFDEASQCRLEEALPVLTRGKRVVIAGDPKQLPPTRFFESAVIQSEEEEPETEQELFEVQQGEVEDLLGAALGLEIEQCYLDVHYRSRNADLIEFSNEHFYGSRLQPLPGRSIAVRAPVRLHRVENPIYDKQRNEPEAARVVQIVKELLSREAPPSIGIACFNMRQRDLILDKLDDAADEDPSFGRQLTAARERTGAGSFEGLFVKNLENVQGDERDHIIISTTYGPDKAGRFYRRFGPVGQAGGARRLNVLVTRARDEVHLVTSIPPEAYRQLPPPEAGQTPGGAWLLFAYLLFAERLAESYSENAAAMSPAMSDVQDAATSIAAAPPNRDAVVIERRVRAPSDFARAFAYMLKSRHGVGSDVFWGNDGFCIDVALHHPNDPEDLTVGVLCDTARYSAAEDPMEWDLFRTQMLENLGWKIHRLWTPHFFRDPDASMRTIVKSATSK